MQHSAGSAGSPTLHYWLAHRLAACTTQTKKVFDSVIVVTDRRVLDAQLQNTIYQFGMHKQAWYKISETRANWPRRWRARPSSSCQVFRSLPNAGQARKEPPALP